jgi:BRCT domain type II-containing protein
MPNFIKTNPRMSYLIAGFILGCVVAVVGVYSATQSTDIYKEQITKLERKLVIAEYEHDNLKTAHKELKTAFSEDYEEIIKPDGTKVVRRITKNTSDSVADSRSQSTTKQTIRSEETAAYTAVRESISKDLNLNLSVDSDLDVHLGAGYRVFPPFSVEVGIEVNPQNPSVIKGIRLGIGIRL